MARVGNIFLQLLERLCRRLHFSAKAFWRKFYEMNFLYRVLSNQSIFFYKCISVILLPLLFLRGGHRWVFIDLYHFWLCICYCEIRCRGRGASCNINFKGEGCCERHLQWNFLDTACLIVWWGRIFFLRQSVWSFHCSLF